jgi:iron(III) transport system substrate-binding protein
MVKMNYLSPVKKLATPMKGARIQFIDPLMPREEIERCDREFDELNKLKS